ncbi:MAG: putative glycoside hydrolase [Candidatus Krumholzibacteriia bacterium]
MRERLLSLLLGATVIATPVGAQVESAYPRLANMYWPTVVDSTIIQALASWDVVVLNPVWSDSQLAQLRALNPGIKMFFIVNAYSIVTPGATNDPWKLENYAYAEDNDLWWYDVDQNIASDWPNTRMANITGLGPVGPRGQWKDYFAARVEALVDARSELDGLFLDNYWRDISWQQVWRQLDSDCNPTHNPAGCDGVMDSNATLDSLWNQALRDLVADIRQRFDALEVQRPRPLAIITNNSADYFEWLNGTMAEYFPSGHSNIDYDNVYGYNWNQEMSACPGGYLVAPFRSAPYQVLVLNAEWTGTTWSPGQSSEFERHKRFTLVSTLLGDGYFSLDAGHAGHGNLWWEPEYDHAGRGKGYLGQPLGPMVRLLQPTGTENLFNPDFANGSSSWLAFPFDATGSFSIDTTVVHSVPGAARLDVQSVLPSGSYKLWQSPVSLVEHRDYTISFWARAGAELQLEVHLYADDCTGSRCWGDQRFCVPAQWTRFEMSFSSRGTAEAGLNFFVKAPGTVWIDDVSLREGDTSLFRRDFDNGVVLLNYTRSTQVAALETTFYRLWIPGSDAFDGAAVTSETIPPSDARIVLRDSVEALAPPDSTPSDVAELSATRPRLFPNRPNPFNPRTRIGFSVTRDEHVHLAVYDIAGRLVRTLADRRMTRGEHEVRWDGSDRFGRLVRSGVYLCRITTPSFSKSRKMVLVR